MPDRDRSGAEAPIQLIDLAAQQGRIRPQIDAAIARVLDHGQYIMGPEVAELEAGLAGFAAATHAVSCASGTDALLLCLLAHGVGPGDAVFVPAFTFPATAEVIDLLGATPVFVDVLEDTFDLDPDGLRDAVVALATDRPDLTARGVIAVDLFGQPADYDAVGAVAAEHDLWVVADAAQSFGGRTGAGAVGVLAGMTTLSFFPAKPLGCYGDGGAVLTNDDGLADLVCSLRVHGKGTGKYDIVRVGINGRLDTLQAAILIPKLAVFAEEIDLRQEVARRYTAGLSGIVGVPVVRPGATSAWAQYTITVDDRDEVAARLKADGVPTAVYYPRPMHQQPAYERHPQGPRGLATSERLSERVLSLPMYPYLDAGVQDRVIEAITKAVR